MRPTTPRKTTRLYRYLREKGIQQSQLATLAALPEQRVSRLVRGAMLPREEEKYAIAQALNVEPGRLFDELAALPEEEQRAQRAALWFASEDGQFFLRGLFKAALAE